MDDDRHGRLHAAAGDDRRRPPAGFRAAGSRRFRQLLDDAMLALPPVAAAALAGASVEVREIPDVTAPAFPADVPLAEALASGERVRHLVVFRRPVERRAADRDDLVELLRDAVLDAAAEALGTDPERWDGN